MALGLVDFRAATKPDGRRAGANLRPGARRAHRRRVWLATAFIMPLFAVHLLVIAGPGALSVFYSLTDWSGYGSPEFIGLDNYVRMFNDPNFRAALTHNLIWTAYMVTVPVTLALVGAYFMSRLRRFATLFRVFYFIPYIVASVISANIWSALLSDQAGLGQVLGLNLLGNQQTALGAVAIVNTWTRWGFLVVIFFAAMQSVNPSLYEAAALDGARPMQQFWYVTIPAIRPTLIFMGLMSVIWSFLVFDWIFIMTRGGPAGATEVLSTLLYRHAFSSQEAGYASAIGVVLALISGALVALYQLVRRWKGWEM